MGSCCSKIPVENLDDDEPRAISELSTQSSSISINNLRSRAISEPRAISDLIFPDDLIIEILLRLPAKSISRFRCVSKEWASMLRRQDFTDPFLTMSSSRPRLLFSFQTYDDKWFFLSAHQPQNPDQNSSPIVVDYHRSFFTKTGFPYIQAPVFGLVCNDGKMKIYNPSTGQSIALPRSRSKVDTRTFFGYDPINKQYKVLCMSDGRKPFNNANENQVLTLGTGKLSWKRIECSLPHFPLHVGICINGVLYYSGDKGNECYTIVCFDVRSEKFKFIEPPENIDVTWRSTMINYTGKLGVLLDGYAGFFSETTSLEFWVLDDVVKSKWSQHIYEFPPRWKNLVAHTKLHIVGMTGNGEIVFAPRFLSNTFYIFFYNFGKDSMERVRIQGIESSHINYQYIHTYIDHIENVKYM